MAIFISYSSQDRTSLDALNTALKRAQQKVWFDQELGGGDSWWSAILEQIRSCDVFIVALSNNWLQSKPSQAELRYAQALNRPILPVKVGPVDSVRVNPVSTLQIIDYQNPTVDAGIQLVTAIHALSDKAPPLPAPLPDEPPLPFGYIMRLGNTLSEKELTPQQQLQLLVELRSGLDEDGDDPSARSDIGQLLRMLRMRHDVTYRTRTEIDNVLAEIESKDGTAKKPATKAEDPPAAPPPAAPVATAPAARQPVASAPAGGQGNKRLLLIGGGVAAVILAIVLVVLLSQGGKSKPAARPGAESPAATAGSGSGTGSGGSGGAGNGGKLQTALLSAAELGTIVGDPAMEVKGKTEEPRTLQGTLSVPDCLGAYEPLTAAAYQGAAGFGAAHGESVQTPGETPAHRVYQGASTFASAGDARAFVQTSADKWRACADQTVGMTTGKKTLEWTFGKLEGEAPKIWMERKEAGGRTCHHVLSAASDTVIDVLACAAGDAAGSAGKVAEAIAAKVSQ